MTISDDRENIFNKTEYIGRFMPVKTKIRFINVSR